MKKTIIIYHLFILVFSVAMNINYFIYNSYKLRFIILSLLICLFFIYIIINDRFRFRRQLYLYLFIFNLLQVFTIGISGITYKILYGTHIFLALKRYGVHSDSLLYFEAKVFNCQLYFNCIDSDEVFFLGFNFLQFIFCIYFLHKYIVKGRGG